MAEATLINSNEKNENIIKDKKEEPGKLIKKNDSKIDEKTEDKKVEINPEIIRKCQESKNVELLNNLSKIIKRFLYIKKVKNLIKLSKENFKIICTVNNTSLTALHVILDEETIKKYKLINDPILDQHVAYVPRKLFKKKNLLKFSFMNNKNEIVIDPKYNTEYEDGSFINVINLKKLKEKEAENEENFQTFLESYYDSKNKENDKKGIGDFEILEIREKKRTRTIGGMKVKVDKKKVKSESNLTSILKERPSHRIASNKKISFGEVKKVDY